MSPKVRRAVVVALSLVPVALLGVLDSGFHLRSHCPWDRGIWDGAWIAAIHPILAIICIPFGLLHGEPLFLVSFPLTLAAA